MQRNPSLRPTKPSPSLGAGILLATFLVSGPTWAGGVAAHLGRASAAGAESIGHSVQAAAGLVAGGLAIALSVPASVGRLSEEAADALWQEANAPLPVDGATYTADPSPSEALRHEHD